MIWLGGLVGGLGLVAVLIRPTLLGVLIGIQIVFLGATLSFVVSGALGGVPDQGHIFAVFVTLSGVAQLVSGYAILLRLNYQRKSLKMNDLESLRN